MEDRQPGSGTLVLLLHAFKVGAASLDAVRAAIKREWPGATVLCPKLPLSPHSTADPNEIVARLLHQVDDAVSTAQAEGKPIRSIVLVGHSFGALLARKLYVAACGETNGAPFEAALRSGIAAGERVPPKSWAASVTRLVLLAGMNRGWRLTHHLSVGRAIGFLTGVLVANLVRPFLRRPPAIMTVRQGAEFITQLRIQWIRMRQQWKQGGTIGGATTIQLLGSVDDLVAPNDNVDLVSGGDFIYLDVPYSGHGDVIELQDPKFGAGRTEVFLRALLKDPVELSRESVLPADESAAVPDAGVKQVLFVIHGIRDTGYWTHKIARRVLHTVGAARGEWATETSSYGYFPMLPFLFPWYRRHKVEWLMDQYTEALARYPGASFSYVGHSNGTYLVAKALELYPCCSFDNIVFAGSVVRRKYDWRRILEQGRVRAVLNLVATRDWVVALFPKLFQQLHWQDLGSAGHDGFAVARDMRHVYQVTYVRGGHGAAVEEPLWDLIAKFVVSGEVRLDEHHQSLANQRNTWVSLLGHAPILVWLIGLGIVVLGFWAIVSGVSVWPAFLAGVGAALYVLAIWKVLTRL